MIEKNVSAAVRELVQYPNPLFTVVNNVQKNVFNMLRDLFEYILRFDLCLYKRNLNYSFKRKYVKAEKSDSMNNFAIYSVVDSVDTDVKKVLDIMTIFND